MLPRDYPALTICNTPSYPRQAVLRMALTNGRVFYLFQDTFLELDPRNTLRRFVRLNHSPCLQFGTSSASGPAPAATGMLRRISTIPKNNKLPYVGKDLADPRTAWRLI